MSITALRQQLAEIVQGSRPALPGLATGLGALDAALPEHGLPRGRLTEIAGAPGSGLTTLARQLVASALHAGWWVAYIDAARTLAPRDWAALGSYDGLWMVRPGDASRGAWCADVLLRSGAFGLVILDGAPAMPRNVAVRLVRLARASDAAFVLLNTNGQSSGIAGALQLRVKRARKSSRDAARDNALDLTARLDGTPRVTAASLRVTDASSRDESKQAKRHISITIEKGGPVQRIEVEYDRAPDGSQHVARCVREDSQIPDRRGVARRDAARRGARAGGAGERAFRSPKRSDAALGRTAARPA